MTTRERSGELLLGALRERAKELSCLYRVDELLNHQSSMQGEVFQELVAALPPGWQFPEICQARLLLDGREYATHDHRDTPWRLQTDVMLEGKKIGLLEVSYTDERPQADEGPFLKEERQLLNTIAERLGQYLLRDDGREARRRSDVENAGAQRDRFEWELILEFLRRTDRHLVTQITRRMINLLRGRGVPEAEELLQEFAVVGDDTGGVGVNENRPLRRTALTDVATLTEMTFRIAAAHLAEEELISLIQGWIQEDKSGFLIETLENPGSGLAEIAAALQRYCNADIRVSELPVAVRRSLAVSLLRRFFTDNLSYINAAKSHVEVKDFFALSQRAIYPPNSHGKLGGKAAGLFLAKQIVSGSQQSAELLRNLKVPKTWYVSSDTVLAFIHYNNLEDLYNLKYMDIEHVRQEYPHIVQVFKNSSFPPELVKSLAVALDDFEDRPLIVRSSSLLEDQVGASFAGKYKSLFLGNQGRKRERLAALQDAIAEVYASIFSPDPIEYRAERGLLDLHEEMGILIQEVVGQRVGRYFLPACAGVAFSRNDFRWSARIKRADGLMRMVPGLGTRAVDRLADDYPVLVAPGKPNLRVNVTADEVVRYSPTKADVINLETNAFETIDIVDLLREHGDDYPLSRKIISMVEPDRVRVPRGLEPDWKRDDIAVTFEGLIANTELVSQIATLLRLLEEEMGRPVDVEFACSESDFFLLQCRTQSYSEQHAPAAIPRNISLERIIFSANRYISNGFLSDITHIVYVEPDRYAALTSREEMKEVGRAVGRLNNLLPRRQFILIGPGRWGSRGDIRLGVSVTYADISNTSVLVEVARQRGNYIPELSFGTHFFQDLVEADIRYLPLYPDEPEVHFNERFLTRSRNIFPELVPDLAHLADTIRVIDVPGETDGKVLQMLMNADLREAVAVLADPQPVSGAVGRPASTVVETLPEDHWRWRLRMAERVAANLDPERFGVAAVYVFGSAKNATAGPASDIDLIVHFVGSEAQRQELELWLDGWSRSLAEVNYLRTGYQSSGLLDVHFVTNEDIRQRTSFAVKIDAVTDAARQLQIGDSHAKAERD